MINKLKQFIFGESIFLCVDNPDFLIDRFRVIKVNRIICRDLDGFETEKKAEEFIEKKNIMDKKIKEARRNAN